MKIRIENKEGDLITEAEVSSSSESLSSVEVLIAGCKAVVPQKEVQVFVQRKVNEETLIFRESTFSFYTPSHLAEDDLHEIEDDLDEVEDDLDEIPF